MKKDKLLNSISGNFHSYKVSYTMILLALSAELGIVGNKFGTLYLLLSFLPVLVWGILMIDERQKYDRYL